ncbi:MAG TPA: ATP-binding cassette domain-containing protein [Saprospiraceae bacterium]|nr:ATP-binding cassette domain-containing protein [Saprospiraceae bacterium]
MAFIQFKNVHKQFDRKVIFEDLSFEIQTGERVLFQGPSGMGKTTLFQLILGFEKVDSGTILIDNQPLSPAIIKGLRQKIAYVPQIIDWGQGVVKETLEEFMSFQSNVRLTHWREKMPELLVYFDVESSLLDKKFPMLSGGERQRMAIILAILLDRKVFLLDEPTAALDSRMKQKVIHYFSERKDATLLVISHDDEWRRLPAIKSIPLAP